MKRGDQQSLKLYQYLENAEFLRNWNDVGKILLPSCTHVSDIDNDMRLSKRYLHK